MSMRSAASCCQPLQESVGAARSAHRARAAPRFDGRHAPIIRAVGGVLRLGRDRKNATENPKTVARPTAMPPYSKASGIIVSASMVRIAPAGEGLDDRHGSGRHVAERQRSRGRPRSPDASATADPQRR